MSRILINSGPTREYLDPVRYLSNGSSGQMGSALASAALATGREVVLVSGPVAVAYPEGVELIEVVSTEEMLAACLDALPSCDGAIAAAAPCDFTCEHASVAKLKKTGEPLSLTLVETPDVLAHIVAKRRQQWVVGFALETEHGRKNAIEKLRQKGCDLIAWNDASAVGADRTSLEVIEPSGGVVDTLVGTKSHVAARLIEIIQRRFNAVPRT